MMGEQTITVGLAFVLLLRASHRRRLTEARGAPQPA
jgi:hypothetical protein